MTMTTLPCAPFPTRGAAFGWRLESGRTSRPVARAIVAVLHRTGSGRPPPTPNQRRRIRRRPGGPPHHYYCRHWIVDEPTPRPSTRETNRAAPPPCERKGCPWGWWWRHCCHDYYDGSVESSDRRGVSYHHHCYYCHKNSDSDTTRPPTPWLVPRPPSTRLEWPGRTGHPWPAEVVVVVRPSMLDKGFARSSTVPPPRIRG
mmetsp:Transcript_4926/g.13810  ORF Transcript_4926/g.13810 Transcript_4926/m.13810 type:complete len:201 (+) Transcript_4926:197-799(+)